VLLLMLLALLMLVATTAPGRQQLLVLGLRVLSQEPGEQHSSALHGE
jgi:hypothetical protein